MGEFAVVFIWIFLILVINAANKSKKKGKTGSGAKPVPDREAIRARAEAGKRASAPRHSPKAAPYPPLGAAAQNAGHVPPVPASGAGSRSRDRMYAGSMNADTHEGEDPCHSGDFMQAGSMNAVSHEGEDPCHPDHSRQEVDYFPPEQLQPGIDLDWNNRDSLVKAFIMKEVLERPCDRKRH